MNREKIIKEEITSFMKWCEQYNLIYNSQKWVNQGGLHFTTEMVIGIYLEDIKKEEGNG